MRKAYRETAAGKWRTHALALVVVTCLTSVVFAVDKDKALYLGGTVRDFPRSRSMPYIVSTNGNPKIEGTLDLGSDTELRFQAGRWGLLAMKYSAISSLQYGLDPGKHGKMFLIWPPWEVTDQFTKDPHYLLTIVYEDHSGDRQAVVFELGQDVARQVLETLERRSGRAIEYLNVNACMRFKGGEECGLGSPRELKGLKRLFVDTPNSYHRELILAEIRKDEPGLEIVADPEGAEIILRYRGTWSMDSSCPCEGGRGEVLVAQGARERVVLVFAGRKRGIWGKKPAPQFVRTFVEALKTANGVHNELR